MITFTALSYTASLSASAWSGPGVEGVAPSIQIFSNSLHGSVTKKASLIRTVRAYTVHLNS